MNNFYTVKKEFFRDLSKKYNSSSFRVVGLILLLFSYTSHFLSQSPVTFNYTGNVQSWTVPPCVTSINVTVAGAKGGGGTAGGNGAVVTGTLAVTPGQVLQIRVGGTGSCTGTCAGGYNGGGNGDPGAWNSCGGGGASDIRIAPYALANRVVVAAGGGGRAGGTPTAVAGGAGGCLTGTAGVGSYGGPGQGGTQTTGGAGGNPYAAPGTFGQAGSLGQGGNGGLDNCTSSSSGGGGGGGLYGGGGGGPDCISLTSYIGGGGGGGGSSLIPPGGGCSAGTNTGPNGYVTISYLVGPGNATATNTGPYCAGATIQLNGSGGATYSWTGPNGFTSTLQNPTIPSSTIANAGTYTLTATNPGCVSTATTNVVVNAVPVVDAGQNQSVCENTSVTLSGSGATSYTWTNGVTNAVSFIPPVGTNTYTVTGTSNGCSATDQVTITVNPNPTINAGTDQTVCAGTAVTLSATASANSTISWNNGVSNGVAFTPNATQTYTATATTAFNCTATDDVIVTVNPLPVVDAGLDQTVCENTPVTLTATGANTYSWDNSVTNGVSFNPTVGTVVYTVIGTSGAGCTATDQVSVTVNPNPVPVITGPLTYCVNNPPTLSTTLPYSSYLWTTGATTATTGATQANNPITVTVTNNFNCSATSTAFNLQELGTITTNSTVSVCQGQSAIIHGVPQNTAGTYTGNFTSILGCDSTSNVTLTILPLPNVNAGSDVEVCENSSITLTGTGAVNYDWSGSVVNGVPFTQNPGSVTYILTGTDGNNCSNNDTVVVVVNAFPVVNAGLDQSICPGESVVLSGSGASTYVWTSSVIDGVPFNPTTTQTYTVTGTDVNGCEDTDQVLVTINQNPIVNAGSDASICDGENITLIATGALTYSWTSGVVNNVAFNPGIAGSYTYTVTGTDLNGCTDTDDVTVTVIPAPVVSFSADVTSGCVPLNVNFSNTGESGVDCNWTLGDGTLLSGCNSVSHLFTQMGCHDVTLTVTNSTGCTTSETLTNYICVEGPPTPSFIANPTTINEFESTVNFINTSANAATYVWDFGDNSGTSGIASPEHEYDGTVVSNYTVTLYAYSPLGCVDSVQGAIQYQEELIYYVPNCFTPDGDMYNQTFKPVFTSGYDPFNYSLYIYNRWGELIFESHNAEIGWDGSYGGKLVEQGTYTWKIEFKAPNNDKKYEDSGHITFLK